MAIVIDVLSDERALVLACQAGQDAALASFYGRFFAPVYRYILASVGRREDAEDLAAEVFVKALRGIGGFRFQDESKPVTAWLFRIARNEVADHYRRVRRRIAPISLDAQQSEPGGRYDPLETTDSVMDLARALRTLPGAQRDAIVLRLAAGLSTRQTAEAMGKPEGTVRSLLHHGIKAVRAAMEQSP